MERFRDVLDHVLDVLELLDLFVGELNIEVVFHGHGDVHHVDFIETQLMPLGGQLNFAHIPHCIVQSNDLNDARCDLLRIQVVAYTVE